MKRVKKIILGVTMAMAIGLINPNGVNAYWKQDSNNHWNYTNENGANVTGWNKIDGKWYYFNQNEVMQTGWINYSGNWYYCWGDGSMATDTTIDGYYLSSNGAWTNNGQSSDTVEEQTRILLDIVFKGDSSNISKIGLTQSDFYDFRSEMEDSLIKSMSQLDDNGIYITSDLKNAFKNDMLTGLNKVPYEVVSGRVENNTAKVEVNIKGFDMDKIGKMAQSKMLSDYKANPSMTNNEIMQKTFKYIGEGIAEGNFKDQAKTVTVTLNKIYGVWVPETSDLYYIMEASV